MKDEDKTKEQFSEPAEMFPYNVEIEKPENKCRRAREALPSAENFYRTVFENTGNATVIDDTSKTKTQLISELNTLRCFVAAKDSGKPFSNGEDRFETAFLKNSTPMAISAIEDGRYMDVNEAFATIMGMKREEIIGNTSTSIGYINGEQRTIFLNELNTKGYVENLELLTKTKGGELKYGLFNSSSIKIRGKDYLFTVVTDITGRKRVEEELRKYREDLEVLVSERTSELEMRTKNLQEVNTALNVLLQKREKDKNILEERFVANIRSLVLPYLEKIRKNNLNVQQNLCLDIIEKNLGEILSPLLKNMQQFNLTPREIQVAFLIKDGKTTKEIAKTLGIGKGSIDTHRKNIRKKLRLNRTSNLQSRLCSLEK
jgi:PAS domain S-box-containing protein